MFGRIPIPYRAVTVKPSFDKVRVEEEKEDQQQTDEMERQRLQRTRYYEKLAVLPAQSGLASRDSSRPFSGPSVPSSSDSSSTSAPISVSRFSRASTAQPSHSLPSALPRSQPIDIPAGRRSSHIAPVNAAAMWYGRAWRGGADDTDGSDSSSSGDSDAADDWCGGGSGGPRRLSDSFVDDSHLQWSGRCLDDSDWPADLAARRWKHASTQQLAASSEDDDDSGGEGSEDEDDLGITSFPLIPPSYHVDFELN